MKIDFQYIYIFLNGKKKLERRDFKRSGSIRLALTNTKKHRNEIKKKKNKTKIKTTKIRENYFKIIKKETKKKLI